MALWLIMIIIFVLYLVVKTTLGVRKGLVLHLLEEKYKGDSGFRILKDAYAESIRWGSGYSMFFNLILSIVYIFLPKYFILWIMGGLCAIAFFRILSAWLVGSSELKKVYTPNRNTFRQAIRTLALSNMVFCLIQIAAFIYKVYGDFGGFLI